MRVELTGYGPLDGYRTQADHAFLKVPYMPRPGVVSWNDLIDELEAPIEVQCLVFRLTDRRTEDGAVVYEFVPETP